MREKARINFQIITSAVEVKAEAKAEGKKEFIQKAAKSGMFTENIAVLFEISIAEVKSALNSLKMIGRIYPRNWV